MLDIDKADLEVNDDKFIIYGQEFGKEYYPILYEWAQKHPDTLIDQITSIANTWHEGKIISACQMFESDLQHQQS
ncbi:MAG TPA: hypothetical protein PLF71_01395 [bacterium]|nr:hypothetical protein [bacterium]